jgi:hypothetical protein
VGDVLRSAFELSPAGFDEPVLRLLAAMASTGPSVGTPWVSTAPTSRPSGMPWAAPSTAFARLLVDHIVGPARLVPTTSLVGSDVTLVALRTLS